MGEAESVTPSQSPQSSQHRGAFVVRASITGVWLTCLACVAIGCSRIPTDPNENNWRFVRGHVESLTLPSFRNGRQCWVYLPPGYSSGDRRYPVLYLNDGQDFASLHLDRVLEEAIRGGEIEPLIVVAVTVTAEERAYDYKPWPAPEWPRWGGGDFYVRALRDTLKPEVDRRFRTLPDVANTAIAGYSLGGLISAYAAYEYDDTFGKFGTFSASYHWLGGFANLATTRGRPPGLARIYQDTGYPDDNYIGDIEAIFLDQGFVLGVDLMSVVVPGAEHTQGAWERRFPDMLRFLFPP